MPLYRLTLELEFFKDEPRFLTMDVDADCESSANLTAIHYCKVHHVVRFRQFRCSRVPRVGQVLSVTEVSESDHEKVSVA